MVSKEIKVLIIEDLKIAQVTAFNIFKQLNCKVQIVDTASKAFERILSNHFDILFIDIQLPDINGFEIAQTIRSMERKTRIPLIAVTANSSGDLEIKSKASGFDDFMIKPLTTETVRHILFKHLNKANKSLMPE